MNIDSNNLPLMETFYSIQGEGFHSGKPAYFIRIGGCDVGCHWCDVKESWDHRKHQVISVDDIVEKYIPPKKGKKHILNIIREILSFTPKKNNTNINNALENFNHLIKKRSICFIVSDFISDLNDKSFKIARKKHDLICLKIFDPREMKLPNIGIVKLLDAESNKHVLIDTSNKRTRQNFEQNILEKGTFNQLFFKKKGIDLIKLSTSSNYIKPLTNFFKKRSKRK